MGEREQRLSLIEAQPATKRFPALNAVLGILLVGSCSWGGSAATSELPPLTSIRQLRTLTREEANRHYPVHLTGVVTFFHVGRDSNTALQEGELGSNMFIQDATGGNWVQVDVSQPALKAGDWIALDGDTAQTDFAPYILTCSLARPWYGFVSCTAAF